jgi:hypothetical protein
MQRSDASLGGRVQRLMHVADEVQQPGKVVRADIVRYRLVSKCLPEYCDLRLGVRRYRLLQRRVVGREWLVDEMPARTRGAISRCL